MFQILFDMELVVFIKIQQLPVTPVFRDIKLITVKRAHSAQLQDALISRHYCQLIPAHQFVACLLVIHPVRRILSSRIRGIIKINRLFPQCL